MTKSDYASMVAKSIFRRGPGGHQYVVAGPLWEELVARGGNNPTFIVTHAVATFITEGTPLTFHRARVYEAGEMQTAYWSEDMK